MYAPLLKQIVIMILNFIYFHTNMNYYISVKGEYNMTKFEQLDLLLNEYGGTIHTFQVIDNGISKPIFYSYVKERGCSSWCVCIAGYMDRCDVYFAYTL